MYSSSTLTLTERMQKDRSASNQRVLRQTPLEALAVVVSEVCYNSESSQECEQIYTVAPQIPESLVVAARIKRGRPKRSEQGLLSKEKIAEVNRGYQQIVDQIAQDANEDNGGKRRKFVCTVSGCGKVFYQRAHLNIHIRSHTGYKPYTCQHPGCGKSFPQLGNMRTHERIHTGDRPFQCSIAGCGKAFTQMGNLKTHLKKIHNIDLPIKSRRGSGKRSPPLNVHIPGDGAAPIVNIPNSVSSHIMSYPGQLHYSTAYQPAPAQLGQQNIPPASILANAKLVQKQ